MAADALWENGVGTGSASQPARLLDRMNAEYPLSFSRRLWPFVAEVLGGRLARNPRRPQPRFLDLQRAHRPYALRHSRSILGVIHGAICPDIYGGTLTEAKDEMGRRFSASPDGGRSIDEVKAKIRDLPTIWRSDSILIQEKKEIIRTVIERVFLSTKGKALGIEIVWQGDSVTKVEIPTYVFSSSWIYHRILDLAKERTDSEIAAILNEEGTKTVKGQPWSPRRVMDFRLSNHIPPGFTVAPHLRIPDYGYVSASELAKTLGVDTTTIQKWHAWGLIRARPRASRAETLWVKVDDELLKRLDGTASIDATAVLFAELHQVGATTDRESHSHGAKTRISNSATHSWKDRKTNVAVSIHSGET